MYRVVLSDSARRFYEKAAASLQRKLDRCFQVLAQDPYRHPNTKRLKGRLKGYYRYRVGVYRVIYRVEEANRLVIGALIVHRSDAY